MNVPKILLTLMMSWLGLYLLTGCSGDQATAPAQQQENREPLAQVQDPAPAEGKGKLAFVAYNDLIYDKIGGGASTSSYIYLRNIGDEDVTQIRADLTALVDTPFDYVYGSFPGQGDCLPDYTLKRGEQCRFRMRFSAQELAAVSATMRILYRNGGAEQAVSAPIRGEGYDISVASVQEVNYNARIAFPAIANGSQIVRTFKLRNMAAVGSASVSNIRVVNNLASPFFYEKHDPFPGTTGTCLSDTLLASGESCLIKVLYHPSDVGTHSDTLTLSYHNGVTNVRINLRVTGQSS